MSVGWIEPKNSSSFFFFRLHRGCQHWHTSDGCASPLERSEARLTFGMLVQPKCRVGLALSLFCDKKKSRAGLLVRMYT